MGVHVCQLEIRARVPEKMAEECTCAIGGRSESVKNGRGAQRLVLHTIPEAKRDGRTSWTKCLNGVPIKPSSTEI